MATKMSDITIAAMRSYDPADSRRNYWLGSLFRSLVNEAIAGGADTHCYCVECGAEAELDCICDDLNFAD